jgi:hypothetical protein
VGKVWAHDLAGSNSHTRQTEKGYIFDEVQDGIIKFLTSMHSGQQYVFVEVNGAARGQ